MITMDHFKIFKVDNFSIHKKNILHLIKNIPKKSLTDSSQKISHTDWDLPDTYTREYLDYFNKNIFEYFAFDLCEKFNCDALTVNNLWFQVYEKGDFHSSHRHDKTQFTNVFFLQLPNGNLKTKIFDLNNQPISIDVYEGDIITFPSYLKHESPINLGEDNKIIISFNIDIH